MGTAREQVLCYEPLDQGPSPWSAFASAFEQRISRDPIGLKEMPQCPPGIMAAPNRVEIEAAILQIQPEPDTPGKYLLDLEIRAARSIEGPNFARIGQRVRAFTFQPVTGVATQSTVRVIAEYIGDARAGWYQLHSIEILSP